MPPVAIQKDDGEPGGASAGGVFLPRVADRGRAGGGRPAPTSPRTGARQYRRSSAGTASAAAPGKAIGGADRKAAGKPASSASGSASTPKPRATAAYWRPTLPRTRMSVPAASKQTAAMATRVTLASRRCTMTARMDVAARLALFRAELTRQGFAGFV